MRSALIASVAIVFSAPALSQVDQTFARYPAKAFSGRLVSPKDEEWGMMNYDLSKGINFGGHFTLVGIPCGTACASFWLVDRRTGKMFRLPESPRGSDYANVDNRANSNLLKVLWVSRNLDDTGETFPPCYRQNYLWTGSRFRTLSKPAKAKCPTYAVSRRHK